MKRTAPGQLRGKVTPNKLPAKGIRRPARPSSIQQHSAQPLVSDYPIATKSISFIVTYFNKLNIKVQESDISNPQAYRMQQLYFIIVDMMIPNRLPKLQKEDDHTSGLLRDNVND